MSDSHVLLVPVPWAHRIEFHDLGSKNGCFVGEQRVSSGHLAEGDLLRAGRCLVSLGSTTWVESPQDDATETSRVSPATAGLRSSVSEETAAALEGASSNPLLVPGALHLLGIGPVEARPLGGQDELEGQLALRALHWRLRRHVSSFAGRLLAADSRGLLACWKGLDLLEALDCAQSLLSVLANDNASVVVWSRPANGAAADGQPGWPSAIPEARAFLAELTARARAPGQIVLGGLAAYAHSWLRGCSETILEIPDFGRVRVLAQLRNGPASRADRASGQVAARFHPPGAAEPLPGRVLPLRRLGRARHLLALMPCTGTLRPGDELGMDLDGVSSRLGATTVSLEEHASGDHGWTFVEALARGDWPESVSGDAVERLFSGAQQACPVCATRYDLDEAAGEPLALCGQCWTSFRLHSSAYGKTRAEAGDSTVVGEAGPDPGELPPLPGYRLLRGIGEGAMGRVYEAVRLRDGYRVAIKEFLPALSFNQKAIERFRREGHILTRLAHPNIVQVIELLSCASRLFIVMEYIDGPSLRRWQKERAPDYLPTVEEASFIVLEVAKALDYCHGKGVLHRDIKPENILMTKSGELRLTDFGLAIAPDVRRITTTGRYLGTPGYVAPESVLDAKRVDVGADLYSLGVVFYELLVHRLPQGPHPRPPGELDPRIPRVLSGLVEKAIRFDRCRRWRSIRRFSEILVCALREIGIAARRPHVVG
ncbi:MAG: serine/threonine protein kinase [Candidatus Riflebacteria bacterium]|nr:serine/threonine protein kinase [Candidatus Riflebacteria bacterium]